MAEAAQAFQSFAQNPVVTLSLEDLTQTAELGEPLLAGLAPAQAYCNYVTLVFRNVANLQAENVGVGTLARAAIVLSPERPQRRGLPILGSRQRPVDRKEQLRQAGQQQPPALQPLPERRRARPAAAVRSRQREVTWPASWSSATRRAGGSTNNRELTTREQNLFGEKYPSATLKALGLKGKKGS